MRNLIRGAAALAVMGAAALAATAPAQAEVEYPYCGKGREGSGGCTFSTIDQCRAFVSGTGGACYSNPRYTANVPAAARRRR